MMVGIGSAPNTQAALAALQARARQAAGGTLDAAGRQAAVAEIQSAAKAQGLSGPATATLQATLGQLFPDVFVAGDRAPTQPNPVVGAGFGGTAGAVGRQFSVGLAGGAVVADITARLGGLLTTQAPPAPMATLFPALGSKGRAENRQALMADLASVTVKGANGAAVSLLDKLNAHPGLSPTQRTRIIDSIAAVKAGYGHATDAIKAPPGYQDVNWKHTRLELDRVLDVSVAHGLSPKDTESAILASAFSDSVKAPSNFIAHNVHGAQAALHVLSQQTPALSADQLEDVTRAILEHQVGPPVFMGQVALRGALKAKGTDDALVNSIAAKVAAPLDPKHQQAGGGALSFSADEHAALQTVGVPAWTVPGTGRHAAIARAVVDADSLVNYACPDGWAKLAALHGPDQPVFLQEPLLEHSLTSMAPGHASAKKSFDDAGVVVSDAARPLYEAGLKRTEDAVKTVKAALLTWVEGQPKDSVPRGADGGIPYLTSPLDYSSDVQLDFARRLRDQAVTLLRAEENR